MVAPKRHCIPGSVVLLTSHPADKQTFSILVRNYLFLSISLLDSLTSNPAPLLTNARLERSLLTCVPTYMPGKATCLRTDKGVCV